MRLELDAARWWLHGSIRMLLLSLKPLRELCQGNGSMRQRILLRFVHLGISLAVVLEDRIPACTGQSKPVRHKSAGKADIPKFVGPRAGTTFPFVRFSGASSQRQLAAYGDSPFENERLIARSRAVGKGADGLGALVFVCHEEIVQAFMAKRLKEPFAMREGLIKIV